MYYSLKRESKRERRVCDQDMLPVGKLVTLIDYRYDNIPQKPNTYKHRCTLHWWAGVES